MKLSIITLVFLTFLVSCGTKSIENTSSTGEVSPTTVNTGTSLSPETEEVTVSTWSKDTSIVSKGSNVSVIYTGTLDDGSIFDASSKHGGTPLEFTVGAGNMIPGFDAGVVGMKVWETKKLVIEAKDAYGEYDAKKTETVKKSVLKEFEEKGGIKLVAGAKLPTQMGVFTIKEVKGDDVIVDLNHEMAGKRLTFEVFMKEIK
jgi:peptidylprolyl isomerase